MNPSPPPGPKATTGDIVKPLAAAKGALSAVDAHVDKTGVRCRVMHHVMQSCSRVSTVLKPEQGQPNTTLVMQSSGCGDLCPTSVP